jgi:tetratricopeptide (TPR) repeat protein
MIEASVSALKELFYRCKFGELLTQLAAMEADKGELNAELVLLRANALFECDRVPEARAALKAVSARKDAFDENYLYALARLSYLDSNWEDAYRMFSDIHQTMTSERHKFKSLLGIANVFYSQGDYGKLAGLVKQLTDFEPLENDDEKISLLIFLGNYYMTAEGSPELAREYFKKALATSAARTWTYFVTRSLYGIAAACEKLSQMQELMWTLEMLRSFVDESEQVFFAHLVNQRFKEHFSINAPMEFDPANKRILIKSRWVPFHDKPLLFQFLWLLHEKGQFVDKDTIATDLWPNEGYKPRIHDPRIFDIAKRARQLIETYENHPVVLLSGRMGYKLASV